jgi:uncharacterized SAM-binding protein YcdF (DUF218 family)
MRRIKHRVSDHSRQSGGVCGGMVAIVIGIIVLLLAGGLYLGRETLLRAIGDYLVVRNELQPADVIHVIAGDDYRTDYAIQLYKQGYGRRLFFTGGWCQFHDYDHGEHGRALALAQGVPFEAIVTDDAAVTSTYSETVRLKAFIDASADRVRSVIVVSDAHHTRRARWTARRVLGQGITVQMAPVPFESSPYRQDWWTEEMSRRLVKAEYQKIVYYHARYQLSWGPLRAWLASLDRE